MSSADEIRAELRDVKRSFAGMAALHADMIREHAAERVTWATELRDVKTDNEKQHAFAVMVQEERDLVLTEAWAERDALRAAVLSIADQMYTAAEAPGWPSSTAVGQMALRLREACK